MNNKLKIIGIVFFIAFAVTVSYVKGVFDGSAVKDLSIVTTAEAKEHEIITLELEGPDDNGNFELKNVKGYKNRIELPAEIMVERFGSVNIHTAEIKYSPGHWCLVDRRYIWCP